MPMLIRATETGAESVWSKPTIVTARDPKEEIITLRKDTLPYPVEEEDHVNGFMRFMKFQGYNKEHVDWKVELILGEP
ncbi:hypothetical protein NDU88_005684 [Pleurodeles waltl]|uniref:Uncharacterized protein n=1 Tax=Pleurodeles waltl TaxID=8319 RepID=A0AAV7UIT0_PLEWA|nr:hypothetical protein NDU88_005684 [Pleurodeles waltl]